MSVNALKTHNHRYSIDIPDGIYTALKVKAAVEKRSVKAIILSSLQGVLCDTGQQDILSFVNASTKSFEKEWNSDEDDKAFAHLQKYKRS